MATALLSPGGTLVCAISLLPQATTVPGGEPASARHVPNKHNKNIGCCGRGWIVFIGEWLSWRCAGQAVPRPRLSRIVGAENSCFRTAICFVLKTVN